MKVSSTETIHFPSLNWGITAGETKELPADKEAQAVILSHPAITSVKDNKSDKKSESAPDAAEN